MADLITSLGIARAVVAGHYAPLEYPSVIAEEVRRFLADGSA